MCAACWRLLQYLKIYVFILHAFCMFYICDWCFGVWYFSLCSLASCPPLFHREAIRTTRHTKPPGLISPQWLMETKRRRDYIFVWSPSCYSSGDALSSGEAVCVSGRCARDVVTTCRRLVHVHWRWGGAQETCFLLPSPDTSAAAITCASWLESDWYLRCNSKHVLYPPHLVAGYQDVLLSIWRSQFKVMMPTYIYFYETLLGLYNPFWN